MNAHYLTNASQLTVGHELTISIAGAPGVVISIAADVVKTTDKAVQMKIALADNQRSVGKTFWLPRKALTFTPFDPRICGEKDKGMHRISLAKWFRPDDYTHRLLNYGTLSAQF